MVDKVRVLLSLKTTIDTNVAFGSNEDTDACTIKDLFVLNH